MITTFIIGDKVTLRSASLDGHISQILSSDTYQFVSENGLMNLPVSADMIEKIIEEKPKEILSQNDFVLIGQPIYLAENNFDEIDFYFINNSDQSVKLKLDISYEATSLPIQKKIEPQSFLKLTRLLKSILSKKPIFKYTLSLDNEEDIEGQIPMKVITFFNNLASHEGFPDPIYHKSIERKHPVKKQNLEIIQSARKPQYVSGINLDKKFNFQTSKDLHIEKLVPNGRKMVQSEILSIQLDHFERYLSTAIELQEHQIYVIHGIGKGKLKDEIHKILRQSKDVKRYKNEFHPRYGFGATEINLH